MAPSYEEPSDLALTPTTLVPHFLPPQMAGPSDERNSQCCHHCEYCSAPAPVADEPQPTFYLPHCHENLSNRRYHTEIIAHCMNVAAHPTPYE
ncbi:MAG: hypothetical protein M1835_000719, partial [Candelina submexicana]